MAELVKWHWRIMQYVLDCRRTTIPGLKRYRDYMIEHHGCENWGIAPNWFMNGLGWGTLTKRLTPWMAGDPVSFSTGKRVSGIHLLPCEISAADYDYYCLAEDPEGIPITM